MKSLPKLVLAVVVLGLGLAQGTARAADYPMVKLTDKIRVIYGPFDLPDTHNRGFRNNPVIVSTSKGTVVLDPGGSAWAGEMVAKHIQDAGLKPVVAVFDSHHHGDHWLGNEGILRQYPKAAIYGHALLKQRIENTDGENWLKMLNRLTKGTADGKKVVGPNKVVKHEDTITIGDTQFHIFHIGAAHTDNDIMIDIVGSGVLYTGDVVRNGMLGIMESDSSFKGNIATIDFMLGKNYKLYIPGHGKAGSADMIRNYRAYLDTLLNEVKKYYSQDMMDYEMKPKVVAAVSKYKGWTGFDLRVGPHISRAYQEVQMEMF